MGLLANYFQGQRFSIILADPPWSIQTTAQVPSGRPSARPYVAMRQVDIFDLDVPSITEHDAVCLLWSTAPLLPEALYTLKTWGFEYKSVAFTWVKQNRQSDSLFWGMGWWTRSNPEFCLLGTKGNPKRANADVHSVIVSRVKKHSEKPTEAYDRILRLCGDLPRVELFARSVVPGWAAWGNEIKREDGS